MADTKKLTVEHLAKIGLTEWGTSASSSTAAAASSSTQAKASSPKAQAAKPEPVATVEAPKELTPEQLAKLSKEERTAYHKARVAAGGTQTQAPTQLSKADRRAQQDNQRKAKDNKKDAVKDHEETLEEMKLAGLSEEQARAMLKEMSKAEVEDQEDDDDDDEDLIGSVRRWMKEQGTAATTGESLRDFNMKVRFQGHVDSTPPDHLKCLMEHIVTDAVRGCDLAASKPQPSIMAKKISPHLKQWIAIVGGLYNKVGDVMAAADIIVSTIHENVAKAGAEAPLAARQCAVVGFLMAVREDVDIIEDEELLPACRRVEDGGRVMDKFIEFLEEEVGGSDDDDEED